MKELSFNYGRLSFSLETFEMEPALPDSLEKRIQCLFIDDNGLMEIPFIDFAGLDDERKSKSCIWLHVMGNPGDEFWKHLADYLDLSDEQIKNLRSPHSRSWFEEHSNGLFWTFLRPFVTDKFDAMEVVNFWLADKILVTRQFSQLHAFTNVIHRLMARGEHLGAVTADVLAAELVEDVLSSYVEVLNLGGTRLEQLQNRIIRNPGKEELNLINRAQQIIWIFLKSVWPIETVLQAMARSRSPFITSAGRQELCYRQDEASSVLKFFDTYRVMSYDLMNVYVSGLGLRTNETTSVLTVIATLFLPPTLIAGIYGMNFSIPELQFPGGYYLCLAAMFGVSGGLLFWLKRRGYINL